MMTILLRTVLVYVSVTLLLRLTGKRQIGQLQLTEFVTALMISEVASTPLADSDIPLLYGLIPSAVLICLEIFLSFLCLKSEFFRKCLTGKALMLIENGILNIQQMKKARITLEELLSAMRNNGLTHLEQIAYCFLESNGTLSVIAKQEEQPPSCKDLDFPVTQNGMQQPLILDGKWQKGTLTRYNFTEDEAQKWLIEKGIRKINDIFYLGIDDQKNICVIENRRDGDRLFTRKKEDV